MKKFISPVLLFVLFISYNQSFALEVDYGIKAGIGFSNFSTSGELSGTFFPEKEWKTVFVAGPYVGIQTNEWLTVQTELLYTRKGANSWEYAIDAGGNVTGDKINYEYNIDYLDIPVLAKIYPSKSEFVSPYFVIGPALSIKLSGDNKINFQSSSLSNEPVEYESTDFSLVFGGGIEISKVVLEIRMSYGFMDVYKTVNDDWLELRNRSVSILAGYSF